MELRPIRDDAEAAAAADVLCRAFNWKPEWKQEFVETVERDRTLAAFVDGQVAAVSRMRPFGIHFGGRCVPMGGYSPVGAAPEHRGQGLATAVTVGQYPDLRDRGEVVAALYPASTRLYRGAGFEVAGVWMLHKLPGRALRDVPKPSSPKQARLATKDDLPMIKALYAEVAPTRNGNLARPDVWWEHTLVQNWDKGFVYVIDGEGYVRYEHESRPHWGYTIAVTEVVARTADATRALWRLIGSSATQAPDVVVNGPPEHELLHLLPEQDLEPEESLRWMLRLVDAARAMEARGWPAGARAAVDLDVVDPHCDWNSGPWRLIVEDGEGRLEKGGSGRARLGIGALSSLYSGYATPWTLAGLGLLSGAGDADLAALHAAFAGPAPWMPDFF